MEISPIDKEGMLNVLVNFSEQCKKAASLRRDFKISKPDYIFVCGMGGSGVGGAILQSYLKTMKKVPPVITVNDYKIPDYATKKSLVFIISFSGNTEEILSCFKDALENSYQIIAISSGGKLEQMCIAPSIPFVKIPSGIQPRNALGYLFIPMLNVLEANNIIPSQKQFIDNLISAVSNKALLEKAKDFAEKLINKTPIIYCSEKIKPVAYRWKTQFNECTKIMAISGAFSEMNHNEILGYTNALTDFFVIIIEDKDDSIQIKKRMELTKQLIINKGTPCITLKITGNDILTRIFSSIYMGDLISYFLAIDYHTDPSPVEMIENLKKQL